MTEALPLSDVKARLSEVVDQVARQQDRVVVTRNGKPAAVLISPDDLESLEETLEILSDDQLLAEIKQGQEELSQGEAFTVDEVRQLLARPGA